MFSGADNFVVVLPSGMDCILGDMYVPAAIWL